MDTLNAIPAQPSHVASTVITRKSEEPEGTTDAAAITTSAVPETPPEQKKDRSNKQEISNAVKEINTFFQTTHRFLGFSVDEASGEMVMQIRDTQTNELIRQIPGEDVLRLAKQLDSLTGILFKARA